jgi:hypothetical protein
MKGADVEQPTKRGSKLRRTIVVLALGVSIGTMIMATPAAAHFRASITHIWSHIRPKADARYDRPTVKRLETIRGTVGGQVISGAIGEWGFNGQLPRAARAGLDNAHVSIDGVDEASGECPGTATNPTAASGYVCIYPYSVFNMTPNGGYIWSGGAGTKWGFQVSVDSDVADAEAWWFANWAYKGTNAPVTARPVLRTTNNGCSTDGLGGC